jgi:hypothetical protein
MLNLIKILGLSEINDIAKYNIMKFTNLPGFILNITEITNENIIKYLNLIVDWSNIIISYDIEFYHFVINKNNTNYYNYFKDEHINKDFKCIKTVREIGGFLFIKTYENNVIKWFYIGKFYNYYKQPPINNDYLLAPYSIYSTVEEKSLENMIKLENSIFFNTREYIPNYSLQIIIDNNITEPSIVIELIKKITTDLDYLMFYNEIPENHNFLLDEKNYDDKNIIIKYLKKMNSELRNLKFYMYPHNLNKKSFRKKLIYELKNVYFNDELIKNNSIDINELINFNTIMNYSKIIGKELTDVQAIINTSFLTNTNIPDNFQYFDISFFNQISRTQYGSATLEITYKNIIKLLDNDDIKFTQKISLFDIIDINKSHNPQTDALMTFIIAIYIIKKLIK